MWRFTGCEFYGDIFSEEDAIIRIRRNAIFMALDARFVPRA